MSPTMILVILNDRVDHGEVMGIGEELSCCRHGEIDCSYTRARFLLDDSGCSQSDDESIAR